ncbi:hypothetical protein DFH11DRAFT_1542616 [Phellopilus nigrolimitatus]|nr:hypothetical protein DFH11DRAFT_1542616 [Phellopilus nigrolimitatus]
MLTWAYGLKIDLEAFASIASDYKTKIPDSVDEADFFIRTMGMIGLESCGKVASLERGVDPSDPTLAKVWILVFHWNRPDGGRFTNEDVRKVAKLLKRPTHLPPVSSRRSNTHIRLRQILLFDIFIELVIQLPLQLLLLIQIAPHRHRATMTKWIYGFEVHHETSRKMMDKYKDQIAGPGGVVASNQDWFFRAMGMAGLEGCGHAVNIKIGIDPKDPNFEYFWVFVFHRERPDEGIFTNEDVRKMGDILDAGTPRPRWFLTSEAFNMIPRDKIQSQQPPEDPVV